MNLPSINLPLYLLPIVGVICVPLGTLVIMKGLAMFVTIRRFFIVWVIFTYILLLVHGIGLSLILSSLQS
jgi:hypothetical protein